MKHLPFSVGGWMLLALFWMMLMTWPAAEMPLSGAAMQENLADPPPPHRRTARTKSIRRFCMVAGAFEGEMDFMERWIL